MDSKNDLTVRPLEFCDVAEWERLRFLLWPDLTVGESEPFAQRIFDGDETWAIFVCESHDALVGFVEAHLREYADGCETSPVGYVEGWYVVQDQRRHGIGRRLLEAAEGWARSHGCTEMASDALIDNAVSHLAHRGNGYVEVERMVIFRKPLS